jgi:hypothetical protein
VSVCSGCEAHVKNAAEAASRAAVPVTVVESLRSFEDAGNRELLSQILGSTEMQRAVRETARAAAEGALASVNVSPAQRAAVARDVDAVVASATRVALTNASREIPRTLAPALEESAATVLESPRLKRAVDRSVAEATRSALLSSRDVIEQIYQDEHGPDILGPARRILIACCAGFFALGLAASALVAWGLYLRGKARRLAAATG